MRARLTTGTLLSGLALLGGCTSAEQPVAKSQPPQVRVAQIGGQAGESIVTGTGIVQLRRETPLGFTSAGRIATVNVENGDAVRAGQRLAALDVTTTGADLSAARAERTRAAAELDRSRALFAQGWVTRPRVENAQATLAAADARVRASAFQSQGAVLSSPGPGRVLARLAEPGQVIAAGTPVLVLGDEREGYILRLPVTDRDAARLTRGAPAQVSLGSMTVVARVADIAGRADRATGTFTVDLALPGGPLLRSGQIGMARIVARDAAPLALSVPPAAVVKPRAGEGFVYVVDRGTRRVKLRKVMLGETTDSAIRVTSGLAVGEWVATSRLDRLVDGMAIVPIR